MKSLGIDTSNQGLGVALVADGTIVANALGEKSKNHSVTLMPKIEELIKASQWTPQELDRIVVAAGPGSYTGLRIGVTTAKTLAWTLGIDLVAVSSLAGIAANSRDFSGVIVPLFDARRNNVYAGGYQWQEGELVSVIPDQHLSLESLLDMLGGHGAEGLRFVGEDVSQFTEAITARFGADVIDPRLEINQVNAGNLTLLGEKIAPVKDVHGFVPNYLKRVEAEENWLKDNQASDEEYVSKVTYKGND